MRDIGPVNHGYDRPATKTVSDTYSSLTIFSDEKD